MKKKYIVELDEGEIEYAKQFVKECEGFDAPVANAIANGTPITEGDLISREALKQKASHYIVRSTEDGHIWNELCVTVDQIDDAPSIGGNQNE